MQLPKNAADGRIHDDYTQSFQGACEAQRQGNDRLSDDLKSELAAEEEAVEAPRMTVVAAQETLERHQRSAYARLRGAASVHDFLTDDAFSGTNEFLKRHHMELQGAQTKVSDLLGGRSVSELRRLGRSNTADAAVDIAERILSRIGVQVQGAEEVATRLRSRGESFAAVVDGLDAAHDREQELREKVIVANTALRRELIAAYGRLLGKFPKRLVESLFVLE